MSFFCVLLKKNEKLITEKLNVNIRKRFWRQIDRQQFLLMHLAYFRPGIQSLNGGRGGEVLLYLIIG